VAKWSDKSVALLEYLNHPKAIHAYLYTTNQLERLIKELRERAAAGKEIARVPRNAVGKLPCP